MTTPPTTGTVAIRRAVFPGSFDPPTVAHLAIAEACRTQCDVDQVHLSISHRPLAKEAGSQTPVAERLRSLGVLAAAGRPWLLAHATGATLVTEISTGFDVVVVGADKWRQLHDPAFHGGSTERVRAALSRLPTIALAPRAGAPGALDLAAATARDLGLEVVVLDIDPALAVVSSTAVRGGRSDWKAR